MRHWYFVKYQITKKQKQCWRLTIIFQISDILHWESIVNDILKNKRLKSKNLLTKGEVKQFFLTHWLSAEFDNLFLCYNGSKVQLKSKIVISENVSHLLTSHDSLSWVHPKTEEDAAQWQFLALALFDQRKKSPMRCLIEDGAQGKHTFLLRINWPQGSCCCSQQWPNLLLNLIFHMSYFIWRVKDVHWTLLRAKHNVFNAVAQGQMQTT